MVIIVVMIMVMMMLLMMVMMMVMIGYFEICKGGKGKGQIEIFQQNAN